MERSKINVLDLLEKMDIYLRNGDLDPNFLHKNLSAFLVNKVQPLIDWEKIDKDIDI